jgi:hypothetical protein
MHSESVAQVAEARALVGMWEGRHEGANVKSDAARIEFREVDGRVQWTMRREGVAFDNKLEAQASGVVVKAERRPLLIPHQYVAAPAGTGGPPSESGRERSDRCAERLVWPS